MEPVIRLSTVEDSDELAALHVAAWRAAYRGIIPDDHLDRLSVERNAERRRQRFAGPPLPGAELVAEVDGRLAGFVGYGSPRDPVPDDWGELWVINLHPEFWRQGIGSRLFRAAEDGLRDLGYRRGYLWVLEDNQRAIDFYCSRGWPPDGGTKLGVDFDPPLNELRCSAALQR
jgi:GNAT superfamily N-acetyltransferase